MAHSCSYCQQHVIVQPEPYEYGALEDVLVVDLEFISAAARDGCAFFDWCLSQQPDAISLERSKGKIFLRGSLWVATRTIMHNFTFPHLMLRWVIDPDRDDLDIYLKILDTLAKAGKYPLERIFVKVINVTGEPAAQYHSTRPLCKSVGSTTDFELARTWLDECDKTHISCKIARQTSLPLRLVEIIHWQEGNGEPKIRLTNATSKAPYAALSYCWGDSRHIEEVKLKKETHRDRLEDIQFSRLPKTIQDGIITTWKLGLRFLWIDCMCIMQDDDTEKANEIAKMPEIYRGAYVTISAARSKNSDEGFLHDIQLPSDDAIVFKMPYTCPKGTLSSIMLFDEPVLQKREPIDTRGWTLQEYLLSGRLLIYGLHGLRFVCREEEKYVNDQADGEALSFSNSKRLALLRNRPDDVDGARKQWWEILQEYSDRDLSHSGDRLLAISGIATHYSEVLKDEYLAGIWRHDLPTALMWQATLDQTLPRPLQSRAPSWSWASIDGMARNFSRNSPEDPNLSVVSYDIKLAEPKAPFGAVLSSSLKLKGLLRKVLWNGKNLFSTASISSESLAFTFPDILLGSEFSRSKTRLVEVWCLQICCFDEPNHRGPSGLILARGDSGSFTRLGIFELAGYLVNPGGRNPTIDSQLDLEQREWSRLCKIEEVVIV